MIRLRGSKPTYVIPACVVKGAFGKPGFLHGDGDGGATAQRSKMKTAESAPNRCYGTQCNQFATFCCPSCAHDPQFLDAFCAEIVLGQLSNWNFRFFRGIQFSSAGIFLQNNSAPGQPNLPGQFG